MDITWRPRFSARVHLGYPVLMNRPRLVVDALNVIGSRPTGWWRDRNGAILRFARDLRALVEADSRSITLIIDGRPLAELPQGQHGDLDVLYASRSGQNAADDRIVEFVAAAPEPGKLEVVTADRDLIDRVRLHGVRVSGPGRLLERLDELKRGV